MKWHFVDSKEGKLDNVNRQELNNILWKLLREGATFPLDRTRHLTFVGNKEQPEEQGEYILIADNVREDIGSKRARAEIHTLAVRMFENLQRRRQRGRQ